MCQLFASGGQSIGVSAAVFPMNIQGWFSFRIDWFDFLAVQGALKSLLQSHNSKASILWCLEFLVVQFSHPYMNTKKTIALSMQTLVGKVMSILFYTLSRFVIAFLPRSERLLNSWLKSPSTLLSLFPFYLPWSNVGDLGLIPGSGRPPGEGNGNPFQYSCLENSMDRGAWQTTVHGITKSQIWLSE